MFSHDYKDVFTYVKQDDCKYEVNMVVIPFKL